MIKYIVISLSIHCIGILLFIINFNIPEPTEDKINIEIINPPTIVKNKPTKSIKDFIGNGSSSPISDSIPEIGSDGYSSESLNIGQELSKDNYITRIRQIIEPIWYPCIRRRLNLLAKGQNKRPSCTAITKVLISHNGMILETNRPQYCIIDTEIDSCANKAWENQRLPPPPKDLLKQDKLRLIWKFIVVN